jgi:hypothetical protein
MVWVGNMSFSSIRNCQIQVCLPDRFANIPDKDNNSQDGCMIRFKVTLKRPWKLISQLESERRTRHDAQLDPWPSTSIRSCQTSVRLKNLL